MYDFSFSSNEHKSDVLILVYYFNKFRFLAVILCHNPIDITLTSNILSELGINCDSVSREHPWLYVGYY